jgi:CheY-like chemotaxis protein
MSPRLPSLLLVEAAEDARQKLDVLLQDRCKLLFQSSGVTAWNELLADPQLAGVIIGNARDEMGSAELVERIRQSPSPRVRNLPIWLLTDDHVDAESPQLTQFAVNGFIDRTNPQMAALEAMLTLVTRAANMPDQGAGTGRAALTDRTALQDHILRMGSFALRSNLPYCVIVLRLKAAASIEIAVMQANLRSVSRAEDCAAQLDSSTFALALMGATPAAGVAVAARVVETLYSISDQSPHLLAGWCDGDEPVEEMAMLDIALSRLAPWETQAAEMLATAVELPRSRGRADSQGAPSLDHLLARIRSGQAEEFADLRKVLREPIKLLNDWLEGAD